jgi:beta-lactam-binding protein with PASTA domain
VQVPDIQGIVDPDPALAKAGLRGKVIAVHGPIEPDAAGIGEAYRQRPSAGAWVPKGTTVSYHSWWESQ